MFDLDDAAKKELATKAKLLIEFEVWFRREHPELLRRGRIGSQRNSYTWEFFQWKRGFEAQPGRCWICNKKFKDNSRKRVYCSGKCMTLGNLMNWPEVKRLYGLTHDVSRCVMCGSDGRVPESYNSDPKGWGFGFDGGIDIDHIQPIASGGLEFDLNNLRPLCYRCNRSRKKPIKFNKEQTKLCSR